MTIVTTGDITIVDINDSVALVLSQSVASISTEADGSGGDYSSAVFTASVKLGSVESTSDWTISAIPSAGVVGALSGPVYTIYTMAVDTGYIDITASRAGFTPLTVRATVVKSKQGIAGAGLSVVSSAAAFTYTDGVEAPVGQMISLRAIRQRTTGTVLWYASNGAPLSTDLDVLTSEGIMLGFPQIGEGDTCYLKSSDLGTDQQLYITAVCGDITEVVHITKLDYSTAQAGATRNVFRGDWATGNTYALGDVVLKDGSSWVCIVHHVSLTTTRDTPAFPAVANTHWTQYAAQGTRGTITSAIAIAGTTWSDASAVGAIVAAGGQVATRGDVVTQYNSAASFSQTRVYSSVGTWNQLAAFFGGDVLVAGTIQGSKIATGAITASKIAIGDMTNAVNDFSSGNYDGWTSSGTVSLALDNTIGDASGWKASSNARDAFMYKAIPVTAGESFFASVWVKNEQIERTQLMARLGYATGGYTYPTLAYTDVKGSWVKLAGILTVPSGISTLNLLLQVNRTGEGTSYTHWTKPTLRRASSGELIVDGSIAANHVGTNELIANTANIKDGVISNAKITELSAAKLMAGTALTSSLTVSGTALSTIKDQAANPALQVNTGVTKIDPGKITVSGTTTLADWRGVSDTTTINGGRIETNSVTTRSIVVGDFSNLLSGCDFENEALVPFTLHSSMSISTLQAQAGTKSLRMSPHVSPRSITSHNYAEVKEGDVFYVELWAYRTADFNGTDAGQNKLRFADQAYNYIAELSYQVAVLPAGTWTKLSRTVTIPSGVTKLYPQLVCNATIGEVFIDNIILRRVTRGVEIADGAITAAKVSASAITATHIQAGAITADKMNVNWLEAGRLSAEFLNVNSLLTIEQNAGLRYQKPSVDSDSTDGIYLGVDNGTFGISLSRTAGGKNQRLKLSSNDGLRLLNASHFISGSTIPATVSIVSAVAKSALPAGIKFLALSIVGGGGGGAGLAIDNPYIVNNQAIYSSGGAGTATTVKLYDGATLKHTFTSAGGAGGVGGGSYGVDSNISYTPLGTFGSGGAGAVAYVSGGSGDRDWNNHHLGWHGTKAVINSVLTIDVSSWASPEIEVTMGVGGAGGEAINGGYLHKTNGSAGGAGKVEYYWSTNSDLKADVVPLAPTAVGSFTSVTGGGSFPDLGAGLWFLTANNYYTLGLDNLYVTAGTSQPAYIKAASTAVLLSSMTPVYGSGTVSQIIYYHFHSMGNWG